mmetsp:Transcript_47670/g.91012  ORF Transcript_47670/g.91012 Transcript_47670/m.91012 type:complete len:837 (+) Transcript_47670:329-2839(+)
MGLKEKPSDTEDGIEPSEREVALVGALAALTKLRTAVEDIPDDEAAIVRELDTVRQSARRLQLPPTTSTRPLLGRMTLLNESLERVVPVCVSEGVRLKKLGATGIKPNNKKALEQLEEVCRLTQRVDNAGRLQTEVTELSRWLKEVEAVHSQGGLVQPRDVEKSLLKRLRLLGLPPRFAGQLDEAEALMGDNMLRILRAGRIESPDFGFAMLAHELEIIDGIIVGVAAATKALSLDAREVKFCVEQLETIQSTMVILQGIPVAVDPLIEKLKMLNESHAELASSALQMNYTLKPLIKAENNTLAKRLQRGVQEQRERREARKRRLEMFFRGVQHETLVLVALLVMAVGSAFTGVALIGYALMTGQTVSDRGEMLIGLGMIAGGAMLGAIAVVSSVVARLHRKVLAEELQDVERLHPPADHDGKENPEAWSALESGNPYASVVSEPASEKDTKVEVVKVPSTQSLDSARHTGDVVDTTSLQKQTTATGAEVMMVDQKQGEANAQKEDTANGLEHAQATANEIISYARHLGIDPTYDADLLWIAEQAYNAPVPENWEEHMDDHDNIYYFNKLTGVASWTHPLEDHFRSLFIKCRVEKEKTALIEKRRAERLQQMNDSESSDSEEDEEEEDINDLESTLSPSEGGLSMRGRKLRLGLRLEQENPLDKSNTGYDSSGLRRAAGLSDELSGSWSGGCAPPPPPPPGAPPPPPPGAPSTKGSLYNPGSSVSMDDGMEEMALGMSFNVAKMGGIGAMMKPTAKKKGGLGSHDQGWTSRQPSGKGESRSESIEASGSTRNSLENSPLPRTRSRNASSSTNTKTNPSSSDRPRIHRKHKPPFEQH